MNTKTFEFLGPFMFVLTSLVVMFGAPYLMSAYGIIWLTVFAVMAIYALSQGFVWGFAGIMCFGQGAFLGIGGYVYAVAVINLGESTIPLLLAIIVPAMFAALFGYFMFYGRISDAYVGVITLTVCVVLFQLMNATSGDQFAIGDAHLGGFNGIPGIPPLNLPGDIDSPLDPFGIWYAVMLSLIMVYCALVLILKGRFGRVVVAIRENETRAQLMGYDVRFYKMVSFMISAGIAGLAGCMYANWSGFISPAIFSMAMSAQVIVFVLVGGLGTLVGPVVGAILIQYLVQATGEQNVVDPNLGLGLILICFVLLVPQGIVPVLRTAITRAIGVQKPPNRHADIPSAEHNGSSS